MQHPSSSLLRDFLEDSLDDSLNTDVEMHLQQCGMCDRALRELMGGASEARLGVGLIESQDHVPPDVPGCETLDRIGQGGMGIVWRVRDQQFNRTLAVKVIRSAVEQHADFIRRFRAEARVIGQLTHPSIVPIHSMGDLKDGRPFYTMKLVEGRTFAELLAEHDQSEHVVGQLQIFVQVCQAIAYAHDRGVIHRDLKPANIMIGEHGEVQVMDWGLVKIVGGGDRAPSILAVAGDIEDVDNIEETQGRIGTAPYMPPEQARGDGNIDRTADVFALGAVLCEILTGQPPYVGHDALEQAREADLSPALERLRQCGCDSALVNVAVECLSPNAGDRPAHAQVVADLTNKYLAEVEERAQHERVQREKQELRIKEERKRRKLWMGLALSLVAVLLLTTPLVAARYKRWKVERWKAWALAQHGISIDWLQMPDGSFHTTLRGSDSGSPIETGQVLDRALAAGLADSISGLDVSRCGLTSVPDSIFRLHNLETLDLSHNYDLKTLPQEVSGLSRLAVLNLGQTQLTELPSTIGALVRLTKLHLPRTSLRRLPEEIGELIHLHSLHLSRNSQLTEIPSTIGELSSLEELFIEETSLLGLPEEIGKLKKLNTLRLSGNEQLTEVPNSLLNLKNLDVLNLPRRVLDSQTKLVAQLQRRGVAVDGDKVGGSGKGGGGGGGRGMGRGRGRSGRGGGSGSGDGRAPGRDSLWDTEEQSILRELGLLEITEDRVRDSASDAASSRQSKD